MNQRVSVVIPCRNEENYIEKCIQSVLDSDYPAHLIEVFVCDGMSNDSTPERVAKFAEGGRVHLIPNLKKTTPFSLNLGITQATGEVVIILGAHAEVHPDYIRLCVETLDKDAKIGCAGGVLDTVSEDAKTASIAKAMSSSFGVGNAHFRTGMKEGYVDTVAFGAYRREVFEKSGLFDEVLVRNQDDEFNFRILRDGFLIYLNPAIKAVYYVRSSLNKLAKQYRQYGYWKVYVNKKHRAVTTLRQLVPPLWLMFLILAPLAYFLNLWLGFAHTAIVALYILASIRSAIKLGKGLNEVISICMAFYVLHLSYGLGYLEGIWEFMILQRNPSNRNTDLSR
jgi:glycosyltransferase involved in cell wall biosynthesis